MVLEQSNGFRTNKTKKVSLVACYVSWSCHFSTFQWQWKNLF